MTTLLIARHGNTFDKGDIVCRVGARTDLPLSSSGREQAIQLGDYLKKNYPSIAVVFTSELQRTIQTAQTALTVMQSTTSIVHSRLFNEIDYGPDEGKPESIVVERIGHQALTAWEQQCILPSGWHVDIPQLKIQWQAFGSDIVNQYPQQTVLVVTSNGVARFAKTLLDSVDWSVENKLATGALSCLSYLDGKWHLTYWNRHLANSLK